MDEWASDAIQAEDREARVFQEVKRIPLKFEGAPILVRFQPDLTAHRGQLLSGASKGQPVFAGSFLRKRRIVLDSDLLTDDVERARILVHELFHFVWLRLGNPCRTSWSELLRAETKARGELGWSSQWRKQAAVPWPDYASESFCDSSAWLYASIAHHPEFTLAKRWCAKRRAWFDANIATRETVRL